MKSQSAARTIAHNKKSLGDTRDEEWAQRYIYNSVLQANLAMNAPVPLQMIARNNERALRHYGYGLTDIVTTMLKNSVLTVFVNQTLQRYLVETCWWNSLPIEKRHEAAKELAFVRGYKDILRMQRMASKQKEFSKTASAGSKTSKNPNERALNASK